ncbi:MAG: phBC6A51 family helix-turn-helix protein [Patescibacteria group bacterium]|nr:phBC6A51 family helix-turn-helix protein [Patescibacteria group bacterium]MCL5409873.1 phBC6A51 family helix-turn-helix protein [Patescibacteria group bacterium]
MSKQILVRQAREKETLIDQLKKTPIVQIACERAGVARATYYRWRKEDPEFAKKTDESIIEGNLLVNDVAESQLMSAIKDKNLTAIIFWLKHHHPSYASKLELTAKIRPDCEELTDEQAELVQKALTLAGILVNHEEEKGDTYGSKTH